MKCCLIHEMLRCIYAHLVLEVGQRNLDNSFHISYISIENFWFFVISNLKVSYFYLHISALSLSRWLLLQAHSSSCFCCNRKRVLMKLRQMDEWTDGQKLLLFSFALPYLSIYHTHKIFSHSLYTEGDIYYSCLFSIACVQCCFSFLGLCSICCFYFKSLTQG